MSAQDVEAGSVTVTLPAGSASPFLKYWYYSAVLGQEWARFIVTSMPDSAVVPLSSDVAMVDVSASVMPSTISHVGK